MSDEQSEPGPDARVRTAWAADAEAIAHVQTRAWQICYAAILPDEVTGELAESDVADVWRRSLTRPPNARNRVLLALDRDVVVGFAATAPADDPDTDPVADGLLTAFHVDPDHTGQGHGSRLLNACVDTLVADGFQRGLTWLFAADDALREFLGVAGWAPDGAHRELDVHGDEVTRIKQVRLHCALPDTGTPS